MDTTLNMSLNATMDTTIDDEPESEELINNELFASEDEKSDLPKPSSRKNENKKRKKIDSQEKSKSKQKQKGILKKGGKENNKDDRNNSFETVGSLSNEARFERIAPLSVRRPR